MSNSVQNLIARFTRKNSAADRVSYSSILEGRTFDSEDRKETIYFILRFSFFTD